MTSDHTQAHCPCCSWLAGFHDPVAHSARQVPAHLTWKPTEHPPWHRERWRTALAVVPHDEDRLKALGVSSSTVKEDVRAVLNVLKGLSEDDIS